jgi:sortase B
MPKLVQKIVLISSGAVLFVSLIIIAVSVTGADSAPVNTEPEPNQSITVTLTAPPELSGRSEDEFSATVLPAWTERHGINSDFVGWIKLGETVIDYPVVQWFGDWRDENGNPMGNTWYLGRDFNGNRLEEGTLFVDWHTPIVDSRRPDNTVIYGHNMNSGRKFAFLTRYFTRPHGRSLNTYLENPTIEFTTVYDDNRNTYKIFAGMFVNTNKNDGHVFNYFQRRFFNSQDEFFNFAVNVMDRSVFYTDVDLQYGDEILTLSTCYFPLGGTDDRFVVMARRVREGEDPTVDTSVAFVNPSPLFFDKFYRFNGGSWAGRNWDLSKVKGAEDYLQRMGIGEKDELGNLTN